MYEYVAVSGFFPHHEKRYQGIPGYFTSAVCRLLTLIKHSHNVESCKYVLFREEGLGVLIHIRYLSLEKRGIDAELADCALQT